MKIGIIGSGNMGRSLGILWAEQGHEVFFGARTAEKGKAVADFAKNNTQGGTNDDAAEFGEVLLYTVRGVNPAEVLTLTGSPLATTGGTPATQLLTSTDVLTGKILIECNNSDIPEGFAFPPIVKSLAEELAEKLPNVRVVKAFNTMSQELFELAPDPLRNYGVSVFVAGDDEQARKTVMSLAEEIGFAPVDCGALRNSRMIEGVGDLIRFLMIGQKLGSYATISVNTLPVPQEQRLGGRQPSSLY